MERLVSRFPGRLGLALMALSLILPAGGCASTMATAIWVLTGTDTDAEYPGLEAKRVAVVCRQHVTSKFSQYNVDREVAAAINRLLAANVKKIKVVPQRDVEDWTDNNEWDDFTEIGKPLKVDVVVGVEIEDFETLQHQTLMQGKANVHIKVYDMKDNGKLVWEKIPKQSVYPPNISVPTADKQPAQFRREYINILAEEIARHFYAYDSKASFAIDSTAF